MLIPISVQKIGDCVFKECSSLSNIVLPNSVQEIGNRVFSECSSLVNVVFPKNIQKIGDLVFNGCGLISNFVLPNSVEKIGLNILSISIFTQQSNLFKINIPNLISVIGNRALFGKKIFMRY